MQIFDVRSHVAQELQEIGVFNLTYLPCRFNKYGNNTNGYNINSNNNDNNNNDNNDNTDSKNKNIDNGNINFC